MEREFITNGIIIYADTNEHLHSFCLAFYVRAGSIFETDSNNGITHLLEHALFKNINKKYGGKLYEKLSYNGVHFHGRTYKEFVNLYVEGPANGFDFACEVLCSVFDELSLTVPELNEEKDRVKLEIREKNERYTLDYIHSQMIWHGTQVARTILGYSKIISKISRKALEEYRSQILTGTNCFFYATGCVTEENIKYLSACLDQKKISNSNVQYNNVINPTGSFFNRENLIEVKTRDYYSVRMGFDIDQIKIDGGVLDAIYSILFTSVNSLFYIHLSENDPLVYSYDSSHDQYDNVGCFMFDYEVSSKNIESSIARVLDIFDMLKNGDFNMDASLNYELSSWIVQQDDPEDFNWSMAYYNHILNTSPVDYSKEKVGRLSGITKEKIMEASKEIFRRSNLTILIGGKKNKINVENIDKILSRIESR
ncbi:MAG: insulinase family protein [Clostridia bacterium]|nr:insulinase family protein [Clostridia bacterium]